MNYADVLNNARQCIGQYCKACPVCNGVACKNQIPGPGAKGVGDTAIRNYNKWAEIRVNMDTLCENGTPDTGVELFGKTFKYPFFAGPVGAVNLHYSDTYTDMTYNDVLVRACAENGIAAFTGVKPYPYPFLPVKREWMLPSEGRHHGRTFRLSNCNLLPIVLRSPIHSGAGRSVTICWLWLEYRQRY